jgi:integrase
MACVRKWRGKWVVDWYDESRKRHIEQADPSTREQAEKRLAEIVHAGKRAVTNQTFKEYGEWWLENCARDEIKESTYEEYSAVLEKHLYPIFGAKLMSKIRRKDVRQLVADKRKAGFSRSTIRNILAPMRGMYNQAIDDEELQYNPAANVGRINKRRKHDGGNWEVKETKKLNTLNRAEVSKFLKTTLEHAPHHYPAMLCAFRTGMRKGELIALKPMDVDLNGRFIEVRRTFYRGRITPPKGNEPRRVDMSIQLTNALDELIGKRKAEALTRELQKPIAERRKPEEVINAVMEGWLFTTPVGTQLDPSNMRKVFHALLTKAELRRIRFHDARHTYATLLIQQGESLAYVKDQLGHSSIQITVDTYGHLVPGGNRQAVDRLDDAPPVDSEAEGQNEEVGNKNGHISATDEADDLQVLDILARPEGFEPPTLRSEV